MKVVIINKSDSTGGAAVVSYRLMEALTDAGVDARMLVAEKRTDSCCVEPAASKTALRGEFLRERLGIYLQNGMDRGTLFKIDNGADGVAVWKHPWVKDADVICLNWINQGFVSLDGVRRLLNLGKPVVWTMHDMWNMTGICHHAGECGNWLHNCGQCPLLGEKAKPNDLSARVWVHKEDVYLNSRRKIQFVAVSHWLADKARMSGLLGNENVTVIPNAFRFDEGDTGFIDGFRGGKCRILFGAARLDDPVKGLPVLVRATEILTAKHRNVANDCELVTFGNVKNPESIAGFGIGHRHMGVLAGEAVEDLYRGGDIVVSSSLYETLPGTLVEGQAWGCVPVATDSGGQRDIVEHKQTGYLVPCGSLEKTAEGLAEGIAWAYNELKKNGAALRHAMLQSARGKFGSRQVAERYIELFRRLGVKS